MGILASLGFIIGLLSFAFFYFSIWTLLVSCFYFWIILLDILVCFMFIRFSFPFALYFSLLPLFFHIE